MLASYPSLLPNRRGRRFEEAPGDDVLTCLAELAPREMRRAWMTAFGNAKLARRTAIEVADLPEAGGRRTPMGFVH